MEEEKEGAKADTEYWAVIAIIHASSRGMLNFDAMRFSFGGVVRRDGRGCTFCDCNEKKKDFLRRHKLFSLDGRSS